MSPRIDRLVRQTKDYMKSPSGTVRSYELIHGYGCSYRRLLALMVIEATCEENYETIGAVVEAIA